MKINEIIFKNYRAFYGEYIIKIDKKNLLIYGENGSGKSSIYQGIVDFFSASAISSTPFKKNKWNERILQAPATDNLISINFDAESFDFTDTTPPSDPRFIKVSKQSPFYTYKKILRTYIADNVKKEIFRLLVEEILTSYEDSKGKNIAAYWQDIKNIEKYKSKPNSSIVIRDNTTIKDFEIALVNIFGLVVVETNKFLDTYFHSLGLEFLITIPAFDDTKTNLKDIRENARKILDTEVNIEIKLFGNTIPEHHDFLNEARLSALAICMYLASLKVIPAPTELKILFLDDIFIGLDMSNRLPLLDILKNEFSDYQIFMTTYDRAWFELAKGYLGSKHWKTIEMYVGKNENPEFDVPVIIQSKDYVERAKEYFKAFDYPACANYLRKACEKFMKDFLPENLKYTQDTKQGTITEITNLETLFGNLKKYLGSQNLDKTPLDNFETYKKVVFNALSHDDLKSPIYKKELTDSFGLVENLQKLKLLGEIEENVMLYLSLKNPNTNVIHEYEIQLIEKLRFLEQDTKKVWSKSLCNVMDIHNKKIYWEKKSLEEIFKNIRHSFGLPDTFDVNIWFKEIKSKKIGGKNLQELINELQP